MTGTAGSEEEDEESEEAEEPEETADATPESVEEGTCVFLLLPIVTFSPFYRRWLSFSR